MMDIDRQIEMAKKKPTTSENLNYIGDLYLKKNDKQRALAYFYEAADKLHFAQKEKKIAIFKKILNVSPVSEKAYIGIIEILSKMGLVMEEKKYLHMLAQLYEGRGESGKAEELLSKIRELDPHVIPDGTFFHREAHKEVMRSTGSDKEDGVPETNDSPMIQKSTSDMPVPAIDIPVEKLIEASLEEILPEKSDPEVNSSKSREQLRYLLGGGIVLLFFVAGILLYFFSGHNSRAVALRPVSASVNGYEITFSRLEDLSELSGLIDNHHRDSMEFFIFTLQSQIHCVPDAFATFPQNMISLLDERGGTTLSKPVKGLQETTKTIAKMNACGRDNAIVFLRTIVAVDREKRYYGLAISGLQDAGPLTMTWAY